MKTIGTAMMVVAMTLAAPAGAADEAPAAAPAAASPAPGGRDGASPPPLVFDNERDMISYSVGVTTGRALRSADGAEVNFEALARGLKDGLDGVRLQITERRMQELLGKFQQTLRQKMSASRSRAMAENRMKARKFLDQNKNQPGVVTLASGVQYKILKTGTGALPTESDVVTVNYRGTLLNGNEFDSSDPGRPANFRLSALIAGWKEALKLMPVGSHWQLFIPPELAYGERGVGAEVGPNELLVFDVELLGSQLSRED